MPTARVLPPPPPQSAPVTPVAPRSRAPALLARLGALFPLWIALVEADPRGVALGVLVLPWIAWCGLMLEGPGAARLSVLELVRVLPLAAGLLLRGGLEVARHALRPGSPPRPGQMVVRSRLPSGPARFFLTRLASLGPGLLALESEGDRLTLHLLDASASQRMATLARVRDLEDRVARLFGLTPPLRGLS